MKTPKAQNFRPSGSENSLQAVQAGWTSGKCWTRPCLAPCAHRESVRPRPCCPWGPRRGGSRIVLRALMGSDVLDVERDSANAWEPVASTTAPTAHHAAYRITAGQAACHQGLWLGPSMASILMSLASQHKPNIDLSSRSDYSASTGAVRE